MTDDFSYTITKQLGVVSTNSNGWSLELNMVSWSDREPKYDIRNWSADHKKMSKGVTLTEDELKALKEIIEKAF